jgi:hypothetical protein
VISVEHSLIRPAREGWPCDEGPGSCLQTKDDTSRRAKLGS